MNLLGRQLGRVRSRRDPRTLRFARYVAPSVHAPAAPAARDWTHPDVAPPWGLFRNDQLGDCTCASIGHMLQAAAANTGRPAPAIGDADVVALYERAGDYDPARPDTDRGAQMLDVLRLLRTDGLAGVQIGAFASVDPHDRGEIEAVVNLTGCAYVGVDLPRAAQTQTVWDVGQGPAFEPGSWGGHAMALLGYDQAHVIFVTWGAIKVATFEWFATYASEAWAMIDPLWLRADGLTPSGFDAAALRQDLAALGAVA